MRVAREVVIVAHALHAPGLGELVERQLEDVGARGHSRLDALHELRLRVPSCRGTDVVGDVGGGGLIDDRDAGDDDGKGHAQHLAGSHRSDLPPAPIHCEREDDHAEEREEWGEATPRADLR